RAVPGGAGQRLAVRAEAYRNDDVRVPLERVASQFGPVALPLTPVVVHPPGEVALLRRIHPLVTQQPEPGLRVVLADQFHAQQPRRLEGALESARLGLGFGLLRLGFLALFFLLACFPLGTPAFGVGRLLMCDGLQALELLLLRRPFGLRGLRSRPRRA